VGGTNVVASAEVYDPITANFLPSLATWTLTSPMGTPRFSHSLTLLSNGKVLAAGGYDGSSIVSSTEL